MSISAITVLFNDAAPGSLPDSATSARACYVKQAVQDKGWSEGNMSVTSAFPSYL